MIAQAAHTMRHVSCSMAYAFISHAWTPLLYAILLNPALFGHPRWLCPQIAPATAPHLLTAFRGARLGSSALSRRGRLLASPIRFGTGPLQPGEFTVLLAAEHEAGRVHALTYLRAVASFSQRTTSYCLSAHHLDLMGAAKRRCCSVAGCLFREVACASFHEFFLARLGMCPCLPGAGGSPSHWRWWADSRRSKMSRAMRLSSRHASPRCVLNFYVILQKAKLPSSSRRASPRCICFVLALKHFAEHRKAESPAMCVHQAASPQPDAFYAPPAGDSQRWTRVVVLLFGGGLLGAAHSHTNTATLTAGLRGASAVAWGGRICQLAKPACASSTAK